MSHAGALISGKVGRNKNCPTTKYSLLTFPAVSTVLHAKVKSSGTRFYQRYLGLRAGVPARRPGALGQNQTPDKKSILQFEPHTGLLKMSD